MILGSDSHTRYGPLGCLAIGEGGPELTKQLLGRTYDIAPPEVVAVYVEGKPNPGVGPQDAALALIAAVFPDGLVQNKILEFMGPGIAALAMDYRFGIDVMTTETTCLSSVWETDGTTQDWLARHGRAGDYKAMSVPDNACYDAVIHMNLSGIKPMIALPFHPSHAFTIEHFNQHADDILRGIEREAKNQWGLALSLTEKIENGRLRADQGYIGGCAGGIYQNIVQAEAILSGNAIGSTVKAFNLSIYPASQPMMLALNRKGTLTSLMASGASVRSAFCGPCFGAGDVPSSGGFSIRHATRNFPNREGSKPSSGQGAFVALMDARSIAATAKNGGLLTAADANDDNTWRDDYTYDDAPYKSRVYMGGGAPKTDEPLRLGPGITDWPEQPALPENLYLVVASALYDPVTTTDELIPSGETSSFRSNPHGLAEHTLSRRDPGYVKRAKTIREMKVPEKYDPANTKVASVIVAFKPGDGSAREQAASCQRVLGGGANIAKEYATKRYRSNVINWGMLPLTWDGLSEGRLQPEDALYLPGVRKAIASGSTVLDGVLHCAGRELPIQVSTGPLSQEERAVLLAGCLINHYRNGKK
jgi:aconitate hydratase